MPAKQSHAASWISLRLVLVPIGVALLSITFGECENGQRPLGPSSPAGSVASASSAVGAARQGRGVKRESENLRLLAQLPGYGGQYYDGAGNLNVYVVDARQSANAIGLFTRILKEHRRGGSGHVIVRQGQYDIGQLQDWFHRAMASGTGIPELVSVGVDQANNRLNIGIDRARESQGRGDVARLLSATGIPSQAVIVTATRPIKPLFATVPTRRTSGGGYVLPMDTVQDSLVSAFSHPIAGIQIARYDGVNEHFCTLGVALTDVTTGVTGFLTAAHCSSTAGALDSTLFYQPRYFGVFIAMAPEYLDPPPVPSTQLLACPYLTDMSNPACRWGDVEMIGPIDSSYTVTLGLIARTTFSASGSGGVGSLAIDSANPTFSITNMCWEDTTSLQVGDTVQKVGAATGWTSGAITKVGVSLKDVAGRWYIYQEVVAMGSGPGDSGAPVFSLLGGNSVDWQGDLWGSPRRLARRLF